MSGDQQAHQHSPETRLALVEQAIRTMAESQKNMSETLQAMGRAVQQIVELNTHDEYQSQALERAFKALKDMDGRLDVVERDMPQLKEARGWLVAGVLSVVSVVMVAVIGLVIWKPGSPAAVPVPATTPVIRGDAQQR